MLMFSKQWTCWSLAATGARFEMSGLTIAWSLSAGMSGLLCLLQLLLWLKDRSNRGYLLASVMALSAAANAFVELSLIHTSDIAAYQELLQLENLAVYVLLSSLVWLVSLRLKTARHWLALGIIALWSVALIFNLLSPGSLVYVRVIELKQHMTSWGEPFTVAVGETNPWVLLAHIGVILILIYVIDASLRAWRAGERRSSAVIGVGVVVFLLIGGVHSMLVDNAVLATPYMVSFAYLAIVLALSYELVDEAVRAPRLDREIEANERRWRTLLENVDLAVIAVDPDRRIIYANPFLERLSGYSALELRGMPISVLVEPLERAEAQSRLEQAARTGPRSQSCWTIVRADGEERQVAWSSVRLTDPNGGYAGVLAIGADITEGMRAQLALQRTQRDLERLMRANILGELVSSLAHELNQPLTAILANAQAARRVLSAGNFDRAELREILDDIIRDDKRAGGVIHGLKRLLRKGEPTRDRFAINQVLDEVISLLRGELEASNIELSLEKGNHLPDIEAGKVEVQQVLLNLLLNAVRAVADKPAGERRITVYTQRDDGGIGVRVVDTGPGVPADVLAKVFDPFFTTQREGLGMGLAISRRTVEALGGTIQVTNAPGGGAQFEFSLLLKATAQ